MATGIKDTALLKPSADTINDGDDADVSNG
jgi:hypothetical protein